MNRGTVGVKSLPKTVTRITRQRRSCDLNPGPSVPESSVLTTRLPSHPLVSVHRVKSHRRVYGHDTIAMLWL